jgi:hypothetical protein
MLCPANILGYLPAIRLALRGNVILSGVARAFASPAFFAGAQRSRRTSLGLKMLP